MLNQTNFKNDIKELLQSTRNPDLSEADALDWFSNEMARVIIKHIKTLEVNYTTGLIAPNGPVTGTLNHTVS